MEELQQSNWGAQGDRRPIPDPTVLTMQLIQRELASQEKWLNERFNTINTEFVLRDKNVTDMAIAHKALIDAADNAFREATKKSEESFTRQILALDNKVEVIFARLSDKIDGPTGIAMRLEGIISRISGGAETTRTSVSHNQWAISAFVAIIIAVISIISLVMSLK